MNLAETIRTRRKQLGLTQIALGLRMWPDTVVQNAGTRVKRFEAGQKPKVHEMNLLAKALEMDVAELLSAEYGEGWSQELIDGGLVIEKSILERLPRLKPLLEALQMCMSNDLDSMAKQALREIGALAETLETPEAPKAQKKSKA